jgi:UDP-glucose 4-epimerase
MNALVTGGAGRIGSDLAAELLARGSQVTVIDNPSSGKIEHIEPLRHYDGFHFVEADVLDATAVGPLLRGVRHGLPPGGQPGCKVLSRRFH